MSVTARNPCRRVLPCALGLAGALLVTACVTGSLAAGPSGGPAPSPTPSPPLLVVPSPAPPRIDDLTDRINRRWTDFVAAQERATRDLLAGQQKARDEFQGRIGALRQRLGEVMMPDERAEIEGQIDQAVEALNQLREAQWREVDLQQRDQKVDRDALRTELSGQLASELESLRVQLSQKQIEAANLRSELSRNTGRIDDLSEQTEQKQRDLVVLQQQLDQGIEQDRSHLRVWENEFQSGVQALTRKSNETNYAEEREEYQRQIARKTKEQASLMDASRRWQDRLARKYQDDSSSVSREMQTISAQLGEARGRSGPLAQAMEAAEQSVQVLQFQIWGVEQLQAQMLSR